MMQFILAVDPGKTTGWVTWRSGAGMYAAGEDDFETFTQRTENYVQATGCTIVCERYVLMPGAKTQAPWSLEVIGVLRYLALKYGVSLVLQAVADAKSFAPGSRLREHGMWTPTKMHANDAARHLLLYLVRSGELAPKPGL